VIDAFFGRTVPEHGDGDARTAPALERQGGADGVGNGTGDDRGRAHQPDFRRRQMHRTGLALGDAADAAVEFREHLRQRAALGDVEAVRTVGREHEIVRVQGIADPDRDGLLADRQMNGALDPVGRVELNDALFDQPDHQR